MLKNKLGIPLDIQLGIPFIKILCKYLFSWAYFFNYFPRYLYMPYFQNEAIFRRFMHIRGGIIPRKAMLAALTVVCKSLIYSVISDYCIIFVA